MAQNLSFEGGNDNIQFKVLHFYQRPNQGPNTAMHLNTMYFVFYFDIDKVLIVFNGRYAVLEILC